MRHVNAKLGNMRKAAEFVVYPRADATKPVVIQSDKRIACFDPVTGAGRLSTACPNGAYFLPLSLGATPFVASPELIAECLAAAPKAGEEIGPGVRTMEGV